MKNKKNKNKNKRPQQGESVRVRLPMLMATKAMKEYLCTLPDEERAALELGTSLDVAESAGANMRISYLLGAYYHIHSIQSLLQADIEIMLDNWGLWLKGVRPAMTFIQQADAKFIRTMRDIMNVGKTEEQRKENDDFYSRDVDSLYKKFFRWEGIPVEWKPKGAQRTNFAKAGEDKEKDETLLMETKYEWCRIGAIDVPAVHKDYRSDLPVVYTVGKMLDDETVQMGEKPYRTLAAARGVASKFAASEKGNVFIIYERTNQWHYVPKEYKIINEEEK